MDSNLERLLYPKILAALERGKSVLLLGPRQTGKSTLCEKLQADLAISLLQPKVRQRYEKDLSQLEHEVIQLAEQSKKIPLVIIDEVQKIPSLMDVVQFLIDKKYAQFILTGSSARKLKKHSSINFLPGRVVVLRLDPLLFEELPTTTLRLDSLMLYGSLPGIVLTQHNKDRDIDLESYVYAYLEEEIRAEAIVRNLGAFSRFLELAAAESGQLINFNKLSQEIGVAHTTIAAYYEILEDCLIAERIDPLLITKTRRRLNKTPKYLFFDLGIRRKAANEGIKLPNTYQGRLFEQLIGLELIRNARLKDPSNKIRFYRDLDGPEVDWVIEHENSLTPIEVKWTDTPQVSDIRYLQHFQQEHAVKEPGYLVCRIPRRMKLDKNIFAIPWQEIGQLI